MGLVACSFYQLEVSSNIYIVVNLCDALTKIICIYFIIEWYEIEIMFEKKKKKIEVKIDKRISIFAKMVEE